MADKVNFKLPDMTAKLIFNISGEDKIASVRRSLENLASGNKLQRYLSDQEQMIQRVIDSFNQYNKIKSADNAENFVKSFNALKAVTQGLDLSTLIDGFSQLDSLYQKIKSEQPKIDLGYRTSDFTDFLRMLEEINKEGTDASVIINKLGQDANIKNLNDQVAQLKSELGSAVTELRKTQAELENLKNGSEMDRLLGVEENYTQLLSDMANEFENFLRANDLDADRNYGRWSDYFDAISHGAMTAHEAITEVKDDMIARGQPLNIDTSTFVGKLDETLAKVQEVLSTVDWLRKDIGDLSAAATSGGGISKMATDMEAGAEGAKHGREEIHQFLEETNGVSDAAELIRQLVQALGETDDAAQESVTGISKVLTLLDSLAHANIESVGALNNVFKNLEAITRFDIDSKKMAALEASLTSLGRIPDLPNLSLLSTVDLSGFNNLSVSKASMVNLATYLPQISGGNVNIEKLRALSQISLANFNKENLSVSKASFDHLRELIDTIRGTSDTDAFSQYDYSAGTGMADAVEQVTQKVKQEKEAFREGVEAKKEDAAAAEAAAKAEDDKRKISELLAAALKREEEATDSTSRSAERHTDVIQQQEDAMWDAYRTEQGMHDKSASETEAEIDREIAAYNKRLDAQQAAADKAQKVWEQEEASAMAAADKKADAEERAAERKVKAAEDAAAKAAAAEQKAAETAVKRTAYDDTKRAVNQYYGLLTSKDTNAAKREDIVMTDAGWASQSGRYAELAQQLNDATASFNMLTDAQNKNNLSGQQIAAINELIATRQKDYALAVENTAAKEAEHAQRSAELAQKKQAEAEAANAAKEAKKQEAEATKAQAQAERDAAKAAKEAEQNANRKKSQYVALNALLVKCENAERKYAAAAKVSNAKENYEGIQRTKQEVDGLLRKLDELDPNLDEVAAGLRKCTEEYSKNSTALQTNTSLVGRYVTTGVQQLKSRLTESLGLAAVVTKSVQEIKKMITTAVELDSAMNTLQIVTRASGAEMDEYGKRVSSMAKETAQATKDLIDATTVYARLGYSMDESAILSKYTAMLQSVGDIDASSAQNAITAIIKAFDKGVNDIEDVMDKMVLVGNGFPISVAQIAEGMNNAGSMLNVAGNSFEESIALLTAANSTIQNISKASTGLRTIAARIRKTTTGEDDEGEIVEEAKYQEMINALTRHHVDLVDKETNQYRSTYEIIKDIAAVWGELTSMEQAAVVEALAGTRQQNIFASLMTQFGTAEDAVERMKNSAGELQEAYDIRMQSIQAHINTLKAAFDELSMKVVNSDLAKGFIDIITKIVEGLTSLIDKIGGVGVALAALGGLAAVKFITGGGLAGAILSVTKTVLKLGEAFAMLPELLAVAGIVASIAGLVAIVKELKKRYDEAHPSFELAQKLLDDASKKVDELNGKLDTNKTRIHELEELYRAGDFTVVDEAELRKLEAENALLETQLEIQKGIEAYRAKQVHDTAVEKANTLLGNNTDEYPMAQTIQNAIDNYRQAQKDLEDAQKYLESRGDNASRTDQTYVDVALYNLEQRTTELDGVLQDIGSVIEKLDPTEDADLIEALTKAVSDFTDSIDGVSKKSKKWAADLKDLEKRYGSNLDALKRLAKGEQVTREEGERLRRWMLDCRYTAEDLTEMMLQMGDSIDDLTSDEANTSGNSRLDMEIYKWGTMIDEIERARAAIDNYNKALEGGNNGDIAGQMQDAWQKAMEEIDAGREDSRAAWALYEMVFSPEQIDAMGRDAHAMAQAIQTEFFRGIFDDSNTENGFDDSDNPYSYGQRLLQYLEENIASLDGIDVWSDDTGLHYWIDDFGALANQIGIAEPLLDALLDDLDAYGSQLLTDTKQNTALINSLRTLTAEAGNARDGVKEFIKASFEKYAEADDTTMLRILDSLHTQGVLSVDPSEYRSLLVAAKEEMQKEAQIDPTVVPVEPDEQGLINQGADMLNNFQAFLDRNPRSVTVQPVMGAFEWSNDFNTTSHNDKAQPKSSSSSSNKTPFEWSSLTGNASAGGKRQGHGGGKTLVNEDGPELISDDGRAFIANNGKPGFVTLTKDAIVFNAEDTVDILRRSRLSGSAPAFASGTEATTRSGLIGRLLSGRQYPAKRQVKGTQVGGGSGAVRSTSYSYPISTATSVTTSTSWVCPNCGRLCGANATYCYGCGWPDHMQQSLPKTNQDYYYDYNTGSMSVRYQGSEIYNYTPNSVSSYYDDAYIAAAQAAAEAAKREAELAQRRAEIKARREEIKAIQDANKNTGKGSETKSLSGSGGGNYVGGADYQSYADPQKVDWVAVRINRLQRAVADLEKVATSGFKMLEDRLTAAKDQIAKVKDQLQVAHSAYARYIQEAESVGLSSDIAQKVKDGTIEISSYDDETRKKIDEFSEWYEKALDAQSSIEELHQNIAQLYVDSFEMVQTDFENQLARIEHSANMTSKNLEMAQTRGYLDSANFYEQLAADQEKTILKLQAELDELNVKFKAAMDSNEIAENSEAWHQMKSAIDEVEESLADANIQMVEYQRTLRQLDWTYFDYALERMNQLNSETQFYIDLMAHHDLFEDNGQFNNLGEATAGLHAVNYDVYMEEAQAYAEQIQKIQKDLESDPYDTELIERREQLLDLQRQTISSAENEKEALKSLVQEGINLELESLKDLIDAYNDSISSAKDLYEYQKKVSEQTADIASIQKQLAAYQGDTSEENRARVQKLQKQLSDAQANLRETEWDQNISDQKKLLDDLYDEYEDLLNQRLDNIGLLMQEMIAGTNANMDNIRNTLYEVGAEVGYTMTEPLTQALSNDLSYFNHVFEGINSVHLVLTDIYNMVAAMARASGAVKAYATGGLVDYTGLAAVHGSKAKPELMLNANDTVNFLEAAKLMRDAFTAPKITGLPEAGGGGSGLSIGQFMVNIPIERVLDYNDLVRQLQADPKFEKLVNAMTLDRTLGKSALGKNRILF